MHVEFDTISIYSIIHNRNDYQKKDRNCGDDSSKVFTNHGYFCDTLIHENKYISINNIPEWNSLSYPISTLVLKNTGPTQDKKLTQIWTFTKLLKGLTLIQYCRSLKIKE